ncbi:MAG: phosphatase PAP2 family protein [Thermoleophilia bacterium]
MNSNPESEINMNLSQPAADKSESLDYRVYRAFRTKCHSRPLELAISMFSRTGNWGIFWVALASVFALAYWRSGSEHGRPMIVSVPVVVFSTMVFNSFLKESLRRERPASDDPALKPLVGVPSSKSFPSSHAAMSFGAATILTYIQPSLAPLFYGLALLMSWSRVYVGVHYPSDVLAGTAVGLLTGALWTLFFIVF